MRWTAAALLMAAALAPRLAWSRAPIAQVWPISFRVVADAGTVTDVPVFLRNNGSAPLRVIDIVPYADPSPNMQMLAGDCSAAVPAGAQCVLATFRFAPTPTLPGAPAVMYAVRAADDQGNVQRWVVTPRGDAPVSSPTVERFAFPAQLRFGYVEVGGSASAQVHLRNPLAQPLTAITSNSFFGIEATRTPGDCVPPLAPGARCLLATYTFTPTRTSLTNNNSFPIAGIDSVRVQAADGSVYDQRIDLEGAGGTPILGFEKTVYNLGRLGIGSAPTRFTAHFRNDGTAPYAFYGFAGTLYSPGPQPGRFALDNAASTCQGPYVAIAPGETCSLVFDVSATGEGAVEGTLAMPTYPAVTVGTVIGFDYYSGVSATAALIAAALPVEVPALGMPLLAMTALGVIAIAAARRRG